jgi:hypothetical protein
MRLKTLTGGHANVERLLSPPSCLHGCFRVSSRRLLGRWLAEHRHVLDE